MFSDVGAALEALDLSYMENGALPFFKSNNGGYEPLRKFNFEVRILGMETGILSAITVTVDFKNKTIAISLRHFEDAKESERIIDYLHTHADVNLRLSLLDSYAKDMVRYWFTGVNLTARSIGLTDDKIASVVFLSYKTFETETLADLEVKHA